VSVQTEEPKSTAVFIVRDIAESTVRQRVVEPSALVSPGYAFSPSRYLAKR
jgi:hypothetical protein